MKKCIRATYIAARLINSRPDDETFDAFAQRIGISRTLTVKKLCDMDDMKCGLLYRICKAFGYQIMIYNPNPPEGLEQMYVVGKEKSPIAPKDKGIHKLRKDEYTNTIFRVPRKYKKKLRRVDHNAEKRN